MMNLTNVDVFTLARNLESADQNLRAESSIELHRRGIGHTYTA